MSERIVGQKGGILSIILSPPQCVTLGKLHALKLVNETGGFVVMSYLTP